MLPTDPQDPKDKAGDAADTCAQAFRQPQTPTPASQWSVRERRKRECTFWMALVLPNALQSSPMGSSLPHFQVVLPGHFGISWESQIPRPVAGCLEVLVEA